MRPKLSKMLPYRVIRVSALMGRLSGYRMRKCVLMLALFGLTVFALLKSLAYTNHPSDPSWRLGMLLDFSSSDPGSSSTRQAFCSLPKLQPNSPQMDKYFHDVPPLECADHDNWVCVDDGQARVCDSFLQSNPGAAVRCDYKFIDRQDDHTNRIKIIVKNVSSPVKLVTDFFHVRCDLTKEGVQTRTWRNLMCGIADRGTESTRPRPFPPSSLGLNVLVLGFDSLSHMTYMRKLPKTYKYLSEVLGAVVLNGYNIVGDGTPQALIPIFTGQTEQELPETRKRKTKSANYVNVYPFLWNDYRKNGYVTAYTEDQANIGTFTYRLKGFDAQPTDHYGRPFYLEVDKVQPEHHKLCLAGTPRHKVFFKYIEDFFDHYVNRPKFFFGFHAELSHDDYNLIGLADDDIMAHLQSLKKKGHLDNTMLVMMSDHGHRFSEVRETQQGKQEERLPFFSFVLPPDFKLKHPKAWANLKTNVDRLTTPFDIYPTLKDVLSFSTEVESNVSESGNKRQNLSRGISLFKWIPASRTCEDAGIEPHWCTCLQMQKIAVTDPIATLVGNALIDFINNLTSQHRSICHQLHLQDIIRLEKYIPHRDLLKYKKNSDYDGFVGDFSDNTRVTAVTYHVKLVTSPGSGHFEATLTYDVHSGGFKASERSISRVNAYGNTSHCIAQSQHHLLKYCYCRLQQQQQPQQPIT